MITIKTPKEIQIMKEGGKILAAILKEIAEEVKPGISTEDLDRAAEALILKHGAQPSFRGYKGFPACLCTSVNEEVVHAIPSARRLKEGDIISLDLGIFYKGFNTDMAITVPVGKVSLGAKQLILITKKALSRGLKEVRPGNTIGDISSAIQKYVEGQGFGVVRELCGHGIGKKVHEDPQIPNFGKKGTGPVLREGMVICLEPMVTLGNWQLKKAKDGYGFETKDGSLSAHFEQTIAVTKRGAEVLTKIEL